ncbi:MAG: serine hydrolase domain-containing protein, partial [Ginsengibacter sp.]
NTGMGSIAISKNGNLQYCHSIGYKLLNNQRTDTADSKTKYRTGSITKMFTAVTIFQMIEEGKLSLQSTMDSYLPDIPNAHLITIENLLRHQSGLHNFPTEKFGRSPKTHEEMLAIIKSRRAKSLPGLKFDYNNTNYLLLGFIIEKICGKLYETVVNENIISKTGLTDIYCGHETSINNNECYSYKFKKKWKQSPVTDMSIPGASGNIVATPVALAGFMDALFSGKLISMASLTQMESIRDGGYGMGMVQFPYQAKAVFGHTGAIDEFVCITAHLLPDSLSIAYCSNGQLYPVQNIITRALDIYFGKAQLISKMKFDIIKTKHLRRYVGTYTNNQLPYQIIIRKKQNGLIAEGMGFASLPLEYVSKNKLRLEAANIDMEFDANRKGVNLCDGNYSYFLTKKQVN